MTMGVKEVKIAVINGSPKGENSITFQSVRYLEKRFQDDFMILQAGASIEDLKQDMGIATAVLEAADLILFSYSVQAGMAPAELMEFMELLKEMKPDLAGKHGTQILTSTHFLDITAKAYVENCMSDFGIKALPAFSAEGYDLLTKPGQLELLKYWNYITFCVKEECSALAADIELNSEIYEEIRDEYRVVILTDCEAENQSLRDAIAEFREVFPFETKLVNLRKYDESNWDVLQKKVATADGIVYASSIRNHTMGPFFKRFEERNTLSEGWASDCNKQIMFLVDGDLSGEHDFCLMLRIHTQMRCCFETGIVSTASGQFHQELRTAAKRLTYALQHQMNLPGDFYQKAGRMLYLNEQSKLETLYRVNSMAESKLSTNIYEKLHSAPLSLFATVIEGKSLTNALLEKIPMYDGFDFK